MIIKLIKMDIEYWQGLACSVSSPGFEEHFNSTRNTEAPFVKTIYKIMEYEDKLNAKLELHLKLKTEMQAAIEEMENSDESRVPFRDVLILRMEGTATNTRKKKTPAMRSTTGILLYTVGMDELGRGSERVVRFFNFNLYEASQNIDFIRG